MQRTLILSKAIAILAAFSLASPGIAQMREAELSDIFESYNNCFAATETGSLNTSKLQELGWARATIRDGDGEESADGPIVFGHRDLAPVILLTATEGKGACVVTARIKSFETFAKFTEAFGGNLPEPDDKGAISYKAQGHLVQIAPTGSKDKPSMRLLVATPTESN